MSDLIDCLSAIELVLDNLICLQEPLQLVREFVILLGDQAHVGVEGIDLTLLSIRLFYLLLVLILERPQLMLQRLQLTRARLESHLRISLTDLKLLSTAYLILVGLDQL